MDRELEARRAQSRRGCRQVRRLILGDALRWLRDNNPATCLDVTDDQDFQIYRANSAHPASDAAVVASWPFVGRRNRQVVQTFCRAFLNFSGEECGGFATGATMSQWGNLPAAATSSTWSSVSTSHRYYLRVHPSVLYGVAGDVPVTGDFTSDGGADLALYRPSTHVWYVLGSTPVRFGAVANVPVGPAPSHD